MVSRLPVPRYEFDLVVSRRVLLVFYVPHIGPDRARGTSGRAGLSTGEISETEWNESCRKI
jgi:hypothetical protein